MADDIKLKVGAYTFKQNIYLILLITMIYYILWSLDEKDQIV